jgi:hypothetical protein
MRHQRIKKFSPLLLPLFSAAAYGNDFGAEISLVTFHTDNALRTPLQQISERQDEYSLGLTGDYTNQLLVLETEYRLQEYRFAKESQSDRTTIEGDTSLLIGKEYHVADLLLTHSRRTVSNALDSVDLLENLDERQIISAAPTLRFRLSEVDSLQLRGDVSKIDYRYAEARESERTGASVMWLHRLSAVDSFNLSARYIDVDYDFIPDSGYEYQQFLASYSAQLSQLAYTVQLGYNASKPEQGEDLSAPSYRLDVAYTTGANIISLVVDQHITDTSMGDGNSSDLFDVTSPNDVGDVGFDQIDRRSLELSITNTSLCGLCTFGLGLRARDDSYEVLNEDNQELTADVRFDYRLSRRASVGLNVSYLSQEFADEVVREDYTQTRTRIYYRQSFVSNFTFELSAGTEERKSDDALQTYDEVLGGITLSYSF